SLLAQYPEAYEYFTGKAPDLPEAYLKELEGISYDNSEGYDLIPFYRDRIINKYMVDIEKASSTPELEKMVAGIQSTDIKEDVLGALYYRISSTNPESEGLNEIIQKHSANDQLKRQSLQKTNSVRNLLGGKPSPKFAYKNVNGKMV